MTVTEAALRNGIEALGLPGETVCVHSSLRSLGGVAGGADAVLDAFLIEGCTVLVPAFTYACGAPPPAADRPPRNGLNYACLRECDQGVFDPRSSGVSEQMGALPAALVRRADHVRGDHPISSFAALGPRARMLVEGQEPGDVWAPLRALAGEGGSVLLLGVDLTSFTLLHLAEQRAGRTPFRRWGRRARVGVVACQTGGCSDGFGALEAPLEPLAREAVVGPSRWRAYPAAATVDAAAAWIAVHPEETRCSRLGCGRCPDAIAGGPL